MARTKSGDVVRSTREGASANSRTHAHGAARGRACERGRQLTVVFNSIHFVVFFAIVYAVYRLLAVRGETPASHRDGRDARRSRREEGEYREYSTDEQRRAAGWI